MVVSIENNFVPKIQNDTLIIPKGRITIRKEEFLNAYGFSSVLFEGNRVYKIGESAFAGNNDLINVELPDNIIEVSERAFEHCKNLTSVKLPKDLKIINMELFADCPNLQQVIFPKKIYEIGYEAFLNCESLEYVTIPEVKCIQDYAFKNCTSLKSITLCDNIEEIGEYAFYGCDNLEEILFRGKNIIEYLDERGTITKDMEEIAEDIRLSKEDTMKIYSKLFATTPDILAKDINDTFNNQYAKNRLIIKTPSASTFEISMLVLKDGVYLDYYYSTNNGIKEKISKAPITEFDLDLFINCMQNMLFNESLTENSTQLFYMCPVAALEPTEISFEDLQSSLDKLKETRDIEMFCREIGIYPITTNRTQTLEESKLQAPEYDDLE